MYKIIFDTSVLSADPVQVKPEMRALEALAGDGKCEVLIPEVVMREYLSQREIVLEKKGDVIFGSLADLKRDPSAASKQKEIVKLTTEAKNIHEQVKISEKNRFENWLKKVSAKKLPLTFDQTKAMLDAYFQGTPPFSKRKERKDILDSLIFETIREVTGGKKVCVVVNDENLKAAITGLGQFRVFSTLEEFVTQEDVQKEISKIQSEVQFRAAIPELINLLKEDYELVKSEFIDGASIALTENELHDHRLPGENGDAKIEMDPSVVSISFDLDNHQYLGGGVLLIPFSGTAEALLNFAIFKSDYYVMDDDEAKSLSITDLNDHYFDAEMNAPIEFSGYVEISIEKFIEEKDKGDVIETTELFEDAVIEDVGLLGDPGEEN